MRVVTAHGVTHDACALAVRLVGSKAHLQHRVEDAALDRFEAVTDVRDGPGGDDRERVGEEALAHLVADGNVDHITGERGDQLLLVTHGSRARGVDGERAFEARGFGGWAHRGPGTTHRDRTG